jgi:hypothetical protein
MVEPVSAGVAVIFEPVSLLAHWMASANNNQALMYVLLVQGLISTLMAFICWHFLPLKFREPRWPVLGLLFSFSFFIPIVGILGLYFTVLMGLYWQRVQSVQPFVSMHLPEFGLVTREPEVNFASGGIKACLDNSAMPPRRRLQALLTMQSVSARTSNTLLQNLLDDSGEDVRLVAYGFLDGREKKINQRIQDELIRLNTEQNKSIQLVSLRHLAELEWELVYTNLAQGDLRIRALEQAMSYLERALSLDDAQAGLWFLIGRIQLEMRQYAAAEISFDHALRLGLAKMRIYPYYAELAFAQRKFNTVRQLLTVSARGQLPERMKPLIDYWISSSPAALADVSEQTR